VIAVYTGEHGLVNCGLKKCVLKKNDPSYQQPSGQAFIAMVVVTTAVAAPQPIVRTTAIQALTSM
jgi:hypothetical protein